MFFKVFLWINSTLDLRNTSARVLAMTTLKSIGAVLAGFVTVFALSVATDLVLHTTGVMPPGPLFDTPLLLLALTYRTIYTVFGSYLTARLAPRNPMKHAIILACIGIVVGSIGAVVMREFGPAWYAWGIVALALPSAWVGATFYTRKAHR